MSLIPAERLVDWTPGTHVGVPGGIPTRLDPTHVINVVSGFGADNTGATNAGPAVQSAIDSVANISIENNYKVIYFPAGNYKFTSNPICHRYNSFLTFRGQLDVDGTKLSVIKPEAAALGFNITDGQDDAPVAVVSGLTKGATTLLLADVSTISVGQLVKLEVGNDYTVPIFARFGYDLTDTGAANWKQIVRITAVNSGTGTITFFPPLYDDYGSDTIIAQITPNFYQVKSVGIEDMEIDMSNDLTGSTSAVSMTGTYGCWLKNIYAHTGAAFHIQVNGALQCEIRDCDIWDNTHTGHSLLLYQDGCAGLIENNSFYSAYPHIEVNFASMGNVFGYNYSKFTIGGEAIDCHDAHPQYNLMEGNIFVNSAGVRMTDFFHGSCSRQTYYRNVVAGYIGHRAFTRESSSIGNIIELGFQYGLPNGGNPDFTGYASLTGQINPDTGLPAAEWEHWYLRHPQPGTVTITGTSCVSTNAVFDVSMEIPSVGNPDAHGFWIDIIEGPLANRALQIQTYISPTHVTLTGSSLDDSTPRAFKIVSGVGSSGQIGGFKEFDLDVEATAIDKGNWNTADQTYSSLGGDVMTDSLYLTSTPSFFTGFTFPPFDSSTLQPAVWSHDDYGNQIPAGARFNNFTPSGGGGDGSVIAGTPMMR